MTTATQSVMFFDTVTLDATRARRTENGYMVADARVARTGIQHYRGDELGRPDLVRVRVYRPEEEVFHKDAIQSYGWRPVTNNHPTVDVTSSNWKDLAVGQLSGDVARDGDFVRIPLVVMDAAAIADVDAGKRQLSMGYRANIVWGDGVTPAGDPYDAKQTTIRANHLAIVDVARGGIELNIGDNHHARIEMTTLQPAVIGQTLRSMVVDGVTVEMTDTATQIVDKAIKNLMEQNRALSDRVTKAEKDLKAEFDAFEEFKKKKKEMEEDAAKKMAAKDGEIDVLKKQLGDAQSPAAIDALVRDRGAVITAAKKLLGDKLIVDGKTDADIRRQVVVAKLGDAAVKDKSDDYVRAAFDTISASVKDGDPLATALSTVSPNSPEGRAAADKAWKDSVAATADAWKPQAA